MKCQWLDNSDQISMDICMPNNADECSVGLLLGLNRFGIYLLLAAVAVSQLIHHVHMDVPFIQ